MDRERLIEAGIDYDEGVERFGGQPALYEKYLAKFFVGDFMATMERQLAEGNVEGAFRTVHDIKGAAGNLDLGIFYESVCALTERLRYADENVDFSKELARAEDLYEKQKRAVEEEQA